MRDLHPNAVNMVMYDSPSKDQFGKKMFVDEAKTAARTTKIDLSMPQSNTKLDLDAKLGKEDVNKYIIEGVQNHKIGQVDKDKIQNIMLDIQDHMDCFIDQQKVKQSVRKYTEPSAGDSIFNKDLVS